MRYNRDKIKHIVHKHLPKLKNIVMELVKYPSISPPSNTKDISDFICTIFEQHNIIYEKMIVNDSGLTNVLANITKDKAKKHLALHSHLDVVDAGLLENWNYYPFEPKIYNGHIYGRGTLDMKAYLAMQILSLIVFSEINEDYLYNLMLICTADEEVGGKIGTKALINKHYDLLKNVKWLISEGGGIYNNDGKYINYIGTRERRSYPFRLTITSKTSGHAAIPTPNNVLYTIPIILSRIEDYQFDYNEKLLTLFEGNSQITMVPTIIHAGQKRNMIPTELVIEMDCRLPCDTDISVFNTKLNELFLFDEYNTVIEVFNNEKDFYASENSLIEGNEEFSKIIERSTDMPSQFVCLPYMTDMTHFRAVGVNCYGYMPMITTEEDLRLMHNFNENISIEKLNDSFEMFIQILYNAMSKEAGENLL